MPLIPVGADGFAYTMASRTDAASSSKKVVLRYAAATDSWDVFALPPVKIGQLIAAGRRLVVLDTESDHPGRGPSGAVLDPTGQWRPLPPDPFPAHPFPAHPFQDPPDTNFEWLRDGVWTGTRLLLIGGPRNGPHAAVAAMDLDRLGSPGGGWTRLPERDDPKGRQPLDKPPTFAAGRVVWRNVVYDPASGESKPTPEFGDPPAPFGAVPPPNFLHIPPATGDLPPDGLVVGNRVVLGGRLFDPPAAHPRPAQNARMSGLRTGFDYEVS
ncbi:MAG TPA: hypothetical protein VHV82_13000 [Sporichthyaceae bacterium]|nr:hypothetical protein [Sporichthyaceae bacterium]